MNKRAVAGGLACVAIAAGIGLWFKQSDRDALIRVGNTASFQWAPAESGGDLSLTVHKNRELRNVVSVPPVPVDGEIVIKGPPGTVPPGVIVQVLNPRSRASATVLAAADGSFELQASGKRGDELRMIAIEPPAIVQPPDAAIAVRAVESRQE